MKKHITPHFTSEELKQRVVYEPQTGFFHRISWEIAKKQMGSVNPVTGYNQIVVDGFRTYGHRLAWYYMTGEWPGDKFVDHINGVRDDNRISNLRLVTNAQNVTNADIRSHNTSGYKGVSWNKHKRKWIATITKDGKQKTIGEYFEKQAAYDAYCAEAEKLHGDYANYGKPKWTTPIVTEVFGAEARLIKAQVELQDAKAAFEREQWSV